MPEPTDGDELLRALRAAVDARAALPSAARDALATTDDPLLARRAAKVLAGYGADGEPGAPAVRVGVLATGTVGPFEALLRAALTGVGTRPELVVGEYGVFPMALATGGPTDDCDLVACVVDERLFVPRDWDAADPDGLVDHVQERFAELCGLVAAHALRTTATLVLHTVPLPAVVRDGVISVRARAAVCAAWHRLNADLLSLAADGEHAGRVVVVDLAGELADVACRARDDRLHRYADLPYADGALLVLARRVARVAQARAGLSRKVLALDLDDTLWGGVVGEVGVAGVQLGGLYPGNCYTELQRTALRLRDQGVILVLASKNDPAVVDAALAEHPEMLLRPEAFAVRAVNWSAKAENLRRAAEQLNLAPGSFVFVDDSRFERDHVRAELPGVAVVAADGDPAHVVRTLLRRGWFDVPDLTDTDRARPELYRSRALRSDFSTAFASSEGYLAALGVRVTAREATAFEVTRLAQLGARTNQFNLTGERFDEAATAAMADDPSHVVASFAVADRFGDEGIVGAAWIAVEDGPAGAVWRVRNAVLSCRVFGRGVELAMAEWIVRRARDARAAAVVGSHVPTGRNDVCADFWTRAGFTPTGEDGVFTVAPGDAPGRLPTWITYGDEVMAGHE